MARARKRGKATGESRNWETFCKHTGGRQMSQGCSAKWMVQSAAKACGEERLTTST